jgi:hypothetical protein
MVKPYREKLRDRLVEARRHVRGDLLKRRQWHLGRGCALGIDGPGAQDGVDALLEMRRLPW